MNAALAAALVLMLVSAGMFVHAALQLRRHARNLASRVPAAAAAAAAVAATAAPCPTPTAEASPWRALPGNVLELGASGFQIRLTASATAHFFSLYSPEGCLCCSAWDMDAVKALGQRMAAWRAELQATEPMHSPLY